MKPFEVKLFCLALVALAWIETVHGGVDSRCTDTSNWEGKDNKKRDDVGDEGQADLSVCQVCCVFGLYEL